jgi:CheY-like chemotaxis protein
MWDKVYCSQLCTEDAYHSHVDELQRVGRQKQAVLVVDDDTDFVNIASLILEEQYDITSAATGKQALEQMRERKPDLVMLDGAAIAQTMKSDPALKDVPIVQVSSLPAMEWAYLWGVEIESAEPAEDWMVKPVKPLELLAKVRGLLEAVP